MKTSTIPAVRVEPQLREQIEQVLGEDESLSQFVENAVRHSVRQRIEQAEFVARGLRSLQKAKRTGDYLEADEVVASLRKKLAIAKARRPQPAP
ncbi:YlcI/YnfO family protein [Variovorax sp. J31P207]|uniref:YlcI/YnfO family protein n=1 Tax=Variovorax sp. J31P207 TaxID=3053510 RepID=UPI002576E448|nr:YlcI/YnfO family protein [Variovorax sp. J31P207]MDM0068154.1 YlcI/YnfO family protein [Variovorax sp. J31P207]